MTTPPQPESEFRSRKHPQPEFFDLQSAPKDHRRTDEILPREISLRILPPGPLASAKISASARPSPPRAHFQTPNEYSDAADSPLKKGHNRGDPTDSTSSACPTA